MFCLKRKNKDEKKARRFMAMIQVILVQPVMKQAKKEEQKESYVLTLLYGIAMLFLNIERAEKQNLITKEDALSIKEQIIMTNMTFAFEKKEITLERTESFSRMVYEVLRQLACDGESERQEVIEKIGRELCENVPLVREDEVRMRLEQLQAGFEKELTK